MFETVTSGVIDFFPEQLTNKRVLVNIVTGLVVFVLGIPFTLNVSNTIYNYNNLLKFQFTLYPERE